MEQYWVRCGKCGAFSSQVTGSQVYLTSCGHFSCNQCLSQVPISKPSTTGYCFDCKKSCAVVNLSQKDKLSPEVGFYFQDPGRLLQKMLEVYNFQKIHRQRKYEMDAKLRLIHDIVNIQSIRERSEPYLKFYSKIYEALNVKYGVKPLTQKCEFSQVEIDQFYSEVLKIKQELEKRVSKIKVDRVDFDSTMADLEQRTPSQSSMCTPRQSPVSIGKKSMASVGSTGSRGCLDNNPFFRGSVSNELRSGGIRSTGGRDSQCSTPAGSVCSKPSPLLNDKRASQQLPTPGKLPHSVHNNPYPNRMKHMSMMQTPSPCGSMTGSQVHSHGSSKQTLSGSSLSQLGTNYPGSLISSTPICVGQWSGSKSTSSDGVSRLSGGESILTQQRKQNYSLSRIVPHTMLSNSPQSRAQSCSPMSVGGTPTGMNKSNGPISASRAYTCQSDRNFASTKFESANSTSAAQGHSSYHRAILEKEDNGMSTVVGVGGRIQSLGPTRPRFQQHRSLVSSLLHPTSQAVQQVQLNNGPRKPLSGPSLPSSCPPPQFGTSSQIQRNQFRNC